MGIQVTEVGSVEAEPKLPRLTPEQISQYGKDLQACKIFASWQLPASEQSMLPMIFMVLIFLDDIKTKEMLAGGIAHCFEYYDKAGPRGINGYPTFMSCRLVTNDDAKLIVDKANQIDEVLKSL